MIQPVLAYFDLPIGNKFANLTSCSPISCNLMGGKHRIQSLNLNGFLIIAQYVSKI